MCQQGINLGVGLTRKQAELRQLARQAHNKPSVLEKIYRLKADIADNKLLLKDHVEWCQDCRQDGTNDGR